MIELRNKDKNRVAGLVDYENLCIESVLESGDKTLSFYYPKKGKYYDEIVEEAYIRTKKDEFVVKAREIDEDYTKFECSLNLEELEGNIFDRFESIEQTITLALNLAIAGTGWTVKDNTLKKRRTVRCTNKSSLEIVREIKKVYRVDIVFNTLRKQIEVYEHLGEDKGTYFIDSLNLIALQIQSDSYKFATRIIAEGKDNLTFEDINNGKNYVENYQYSKKVKTLYWKDERYTIKESLLEDARAKLEEISKPFISYNASILNLAELNPKYKNILDYQLGDTITLLSKNNKVKDKQRIVKTLEYPQDHSRDTVELANAVLKFEDIQQENQETTDTVSNITTDNGTVDGSTIDSITTKQIEDFEANVIKVAKLKAILAEIENLHVNKADIQNLNAVIARIGTLEATKASITELNAIHAIIQQIKAGKADIADLNAAVAKVGILENKTAVLENALLGNLTADNFKANSITATSGIIAEGAIGSAQISSLSVNKLEAGEFITSKHKIVSADGTIEIVGNQILINRNNVNRVILGEYRKSDGTTEYGLLVRAKDGQTIMLDGNGVHNAGITDGAIDNNKVADNANISGNKLDINSVIREVNNNGTETIKGTKVTVGDRTLDVELSTQKNIITEHSKELSSQKATIQTLDNSLKLKLDTQTFSETKKQITSDISNKMNNLKYSLESYADIVAMNKANNALVNAERKVKDSLKQAKEYTNTEITTVNSHLNKATTELNLLKGEVSSKVNKTDIDKTVKEIKDKIKVTSDKISTAESSFTQKTNEIKANLSNLESETTTKIINVKNEAVKESRSIPDTRNDNQQPSWYMKNYPNQTITEFKYADVIQISNSKVYGTLETTTPWWDASGGYPTQIFRSNSTSTFQRHGISDNTWSEWEQIENTKESQAKATEALNNAKAFVNAEIKTVNTKVHNLESNITILTDRINSKVSQSDIDRSITTVDNKIKVVDSKISDISSNVTQLRDSVTTEINSINSKTTTLNGKIVNAETRLNSVEAKITDTSIINTVRREFYSKGETDNMYSSKTEVIQLSNSLEWKISTLGAGNIIINSSFNGGFDCWERFRNPILSTNTEFLPDRYGKMISIEGDGGIYQRFPTIPGEKYTVSFYAEANQLKPLATTIGIEGINLITLKFESGWKRWSFTFTATSKEHTFIAYLGQYGKFYLGRVMVTKGSILQEYREGLGIYSNIAKFDTNGFTVESSSTNTRTITDSAGFRVQDKSTGENLLEANVKGVSARGGRFFVDGPNGNYTLMWGRDIVINGQRALVGTHSHPEASLQPNKVYLNYNNDFRNGVEIGGKLTNNTFDVLSLISSQKSESGFRKLSDGFMIVWGKVNINIKDGWIIEGTIPFHTKFPNACFLFNANLEKVDNNDYWTANYTLNSYALDKNGGRVYGLNLQKYIGKQGAIAQISYIAIGC
ncbi:phage minor structural protein [Clostridium perfringens]|uniref:Phage minor structural protein n=1 Tax=Clostridium perfringens TaxID=1502 RepID=A0A2X3BRS3_CLOPF|nr:phage tail spike protein [Clostridium perfringens]SQC06702.1 phage minor structural protein [Clostridium perfringens]